MERLPCEEASPKPKLVVEFHGFNHSPANVEGVRAIGGALRTHLISYPGRNVLYFEDASGTITSSKNQRETIKKFGFLGWFASNTLSDEDGLITEQTIWDRLKAIQAGSEEDVFNSNLFSINRIQDYFLALTLDEIRAEHDFEVDFEKHDPKTHDRLRKEGDYLDSDEKDLSKIWGKGDFKLVAENVLEVGHSLRVFSTARDDDTVQNLKSICKARLKQAGNSSIFILYGAAHYELVDSLSRKLGNNSNVSTKTNVPKNSEELQFLPLRAFLEDGQVSSLLVARYALTDVLITKLAVEIDLADFSYNYLTICKEVDKIVHRLTEQEIRKLCEEKVDLAQFFREQPEAHTLTGAFQHV